MYSIVVRKIEQTVVFLIIYIVPVVALVLLGLLFWKVLAPGEIQESLAWTGLRLLGILLAIKPFSVICKRDFLAIYRKMPEGITYILKGRTTDPVWKYIKNLIVNGVYSISLYGLRLRKWLGILTFRTILLHRLSLEIRTYHAGFPLLVLSNNLFIRAGIVGLFALLVGFLTSNMRSMKKLRRRWKPVQQIAYLAFLGGCIHLFFLEHNRGFIVLFIVFVGLKIREWMPMKKAISVVGGPSVPTQEINSTINNIDAKIINRTLLTHDVMELVIDVRQELDITPGQWALLTLQDAQGTFNRAYSIVDYDVDQGSTMIVLVVKLINGRGTSLLQHMHIGDGIKLKGIYGKFMLQQTDAPKFFIGTGTGIAPLINMAKHTSAKEKYLFFSVPFAKDVFYEDRMKDIHDLVYEIHTTREDMPGYVSGRLDLEKISLPKNAEIYVCGGPKIVEEIVEKLKALGQMNIFVEKF